MFVRQYCQLDCPHQRVACVRINNIMGACSYCSKALDARTVLWVYSETVTKILSLLISCGDMLQTAINKPVFFLPFATFAILCVVASALSFVLIQRELLVDVYFC